jgi:hypothetical protein
MVIPKYLGLRGELFKNNAHTKPRLKQLSWFYVGDLILLIRIAHFNGLDGRD